MGDVAAVRRSWMFMMNDGDGYRPVREMNTNSSGSARSVESGEAINIRGASTTGLSPDIPWATMPNSLDESADEVDLIPSKSRDVRDPDAVLLRQEDSASLSSDARSGRAVIISSGVAEAARWNIDGQSGPLVGSSSSSVIANFGRGTETSP
jgi:hypothetical protein